MPADALSSWVVSCLLLGLRVAPVFALAPPFSLMRVPRLFLLLLGLGLSVALVGAHPQDVLLADMSPHGILVAAVRELLLGSLFVLAFQLMFGALYFAGRTIDIQAGFGFATLVDPASNTATPLVGGLFAYAAGAVFFAAGGHLDLLRIFAASLHAVPLGTWALPDSLDRITGFIGIVMLSAFGIAGAAVLALFLADMTIAMMSRTVPQMNVLVLGFQVKTILVLLVLPISFGLSGALFLRLSAVLVQSLPGML